MNGTTGSRSPSTSPSSPPQPPPKRLKLVRQLSLNSLNVLATAFNRLDGVRIRRQRTQRYRIPRRTTDRLLTLRTRTAPVSGPVRSGPVRFRSTCRVVGVLQAHSRA